MTFEAVQVGEILLSVDNFTVMRADYILFVTGKSERWITANYIGLDAPASKVFEIPKENWDNTGWSYCRARPYKVFKDHKNMIFRELFQ
jgi:hypothetical protein